LLILLKKNRKVSSGEDVLRCLRQIREIDRIINNNHSEIETKVIKSYIKDLTIILENLNRQISSYLETQQKY